MYSGAAQIESPDGSPVARARRQRAHNEHLVETHFAMKNIAAGDPEGEAEAMRTHTSERRRKMLLKSDKFDPKSRD